MNDCVDVLQAPLCIVADLMLRPVCLPGVQVACSRVVHSQVICLPNIAGGPIVFQGDHWGPVFVHVDVFTGLIAQNLMTIIDKRKLHKTKWRCVFS